MLLPATPSSFHDPDDSTSGDNHSIKPKHEHQSPATRQHSSTSEVSRPSLGPYPQYDMPPAHMYTKHILDSNVGNLEKEEYALYHQLTDMTERFATYHLDASTPLAESATSFRMLRVRAGNLAERTQSWIQDVSKYRGTWEYFITLPRVEFTREDAKLRSLLTQLGKTVEVAQARLEREMEEGMYLEAKEGMEVE